jgi:hypothetical protein
LQALHVYLTSVSMKSARQFTRLQIPAPIDINGVAGRTFDVSEGGCCAEVRASMRAGMPVFGRIALGARQFDFRGEVVWSGGAPGLRRVGIRFMGVEHAWFQALQARPQAVLNVS